MEDEFIKDMNIKQNYSNVLLVEITTTDKSKISADFSDEERLIKAIELFDKKKNKLLSMKEELDKKLNVGKKKSSNSGAFFAGRNSK